MEFDASSPQGKANGGVISSAPVPHSFMSSIGLRCERSMKIITLAASLAAVILVPAVSVYAQSGPTLDAVLERLDQLEQQNVELREQLGVLRQELERIRQAPPEGAASTAARVDALEEKVDLHEGRISEQDQVKTQSAQRVPIRLTGVLLFSVFRNSSHGVLAANDYPVAARTDSAPATWAGTLRRSIIGAEFQVPDAVLGGKFRGSIFTDLTEAGDALTNIQPRLRTVSIEGRWNHFAVFAGQDKPIFSVRDPTSLAQVQFAPLNGAGNFWLYRPQVRVEEIVPLGRRNEFRARLGVSQAPETGGTIPAESRASIEPRRAALEGHFQIARQWDSVRRLEIGSGFHRSTTHVLGTFVPADLISLDWFVKPVQWAEFTGAVFTGENMSKGGSSGFAQGHALIPISPGVFQPVPVARHGGWVQLTFVPTSRLTVNLQSGVDHAENDYLLPTSLTRNRALVFNTFYRLAPNILLGFEYGNIRTDFKDGQSPTYTHNDLHIAYLF